GHRRNRENGSARLFDVIRAAALLHTITSPDWSTWPTPMEILRCATMGGAGGSMMKDDVGSLTPGKKADLVMLDTTTLNFTPFSDARKHLVYSENGTSVETVIVDGEIVIEDGKTTRVDERAVIDEFREAIPAFLRHYEEVEQSNRRFEPFV